MAMEKGNKVYSWYTHRSGTILKLKLPLQAVVRWSEGNEQLVPVDTLRKVPTKQAIYNELKYAYKNNIPFERMIPVLEKEYGDAVLPILEDTIEFFKVRKGNTFTNGRRVGTIDSIKENMCDINFGNGDRQRIQKRELVLAWEKILDEEEE